MGLILKDSVPMLMKGYPTVSDKYNVQGGILAGSESVNFGQLVKYSGTTGYYEAVSATNTVTDGEVAGFVVATNVKLATQWPGDDSSVVTKVGEAFNLLIDGYIAVEIASDLTIKEAEPVYCTSAGAITNVSTGNIAINATFTGIKETTNGKVLAEIRVK